MLLSFAVFAAIVLVAFAVRNRGRPRRVHGGRRTALLAGREFGGDGWTSGAGGGGSGADGGSGGDGGGD